jgi:hypothetical protein
VEWVKEARCMEREATLGRGGAKSTKAKLSAAPTESAPNHGNPLVNPATRLLPSTSSANADKVPAIERLVISFCFLTLGAGDLVVS